MSQNEYFESTYNQFLTKCWYQLLKQSYVKKTTKQSKTNTAKIGQ